MATDSAVTVSGLGITALLADISGLLAGYPVISFAGMGMIGGAAGWALAMDRGEMDTATLRWVACFLTRRLLLGLCIGISAAVWWADGRESQGLWMFVAGLVSIDPVRGVRAVWTRVIEMLPRRV